MNVGAREVAPTLAWGLTCAVILLCPPICCLSAEKDGSLMYSPSCCEPSTASPRLEGVWLNKAETDPQQKRRVKG